MATKKKKTTGRKPVLIALLRGINVGGNKSLPMVELRALATKLGFEDVATYIQSGNLLFRSELTPEQAEDKLEQAIEKRFGFDVAVVVRTAEQVQRHAKGGAFTDAEQARPKILHYALAKRAPVKGAGDALLAYAKAGERIAMRPDGLWIDFLDGVARSKLTPAVLDRLVGSSVTARNFRTMQTLAEMARAMDETPGSE